MSSPTSSLGSGDGGGGAENRWRVAYLRKTSELWPDEVAQEEELLSSPTFSLGSWVGLKTGGGWHT
jgi:hypothetical protein